MCFKKICKLPFVKSLSGKAPTDDFATPPDMIFFLSPAQGQALHLAITKCFLQRTLTRGLIAVNIIG